MVARASLGAEPSSLAPSVLAGRHRGGRRRPARGPWPASRTARDRSAFAMSPMKLVTSWVGLLPPLVKAADRVYQQFQFRVMDALPNLKDELQIPSPLKKQRKIQLIDEKGRCICAEPLSTNFILHFLRF